MLKKEAEIWLVERVNADDTGELRAQAMHGLPVR